MMKTTVKMAWAAFAVAGLTACSSDKPIPDPAIAACPEELVTVVQANQTFLDTVKVGQTPGSKLGGLDGLKRRATLAKAGAPAMDVYFYQTGIPRCPWVMAAESLTPVVVKDGVITAYGTEAVKDLTTHGWELKEAAWPWQRYDFGYLPKK